MKIYIETDMTEMPKSCDLCEFKCGSWYKVDLAEVVNASDNQTRLKNCPLRTETEIADKAKEKEDEQ